MKTTDKPIVVSQDFNASINTVWKAITEPSKMQLWFFENMPDFKAEVGFKTLFKVYSGKRTFTHLWEIVEVIPQQKIVYSWKYLEYAGTAFISFELIKNNTQTILTVTNTVLEDFTEKIPEFKSESCLDGWQYFIQKRLKNFLQTKL